ncbi:prepilin-type N-terminal cleavage/methylation domain-containing protein [candidate division WWE3 bacterium]|jgi:general secretion pathway protein G|uniref:Prepilin-type N-terminal cleavage/methylation domain-containing protein n=1 Tax=candidate division WWE3 bacterium TaxID=2053526 RepID=A0A3A4ZL22_UNCKA|nr:MAG: prepilin-type N-terminal cleavage/methylation domain-containing protein [candidate division WWE3 bacterium]
MIEPKIARMKKTKQSGFTLIELLLVVIIIGVLSGLVLSVINVAGIRARSRDAQRSGDLKRIQTALELYFADNRGYPQNSASWSRTPGILATPLQGTYVQVIPIDPRNNENIGAATCGMTTYGYYYRTNTCVGAGCLSSRYVLITLMETQTSAAQSLCNSLSNCTSGNVTGCNCGTPCYGVENPL